jgi:beta-aspartyl-dipeptidase (metallo-type)
MVEVIAHRGGQTSDGAQAVERACGVRAAFCAGRVRVTVSSDANGSAIFCDPAGRTTSIVPQRVEHLWQQVRAAVLEEGVPLADAISTVTANAAALFGLAHRGRIAVGQDADLVLLDERLKIVDGYARDRALVRERRLLQPGIFGA